MTFDENGQIRLLEADVAEHTKTLRDESESFLTKISEFHDVAKTLVDEIQTQAQRIEQAKLRAIGARSSVVVEKEQRRRKRAQLDAVIRERQAELDRLVAEFDSLARIEQEQRAMIEKLSNNEA